LDSRLISQALILFLLLLGAVLTVTYTPDEATANNTTTATTTPPTTATMHTPGLAGNIVQKGSDTVLPLAQLYAENFMDNNTGVVIQVAGGGSSVGFTSLIGGNTDIADASRQMKQSELQSARDNGVDAVEWKIALDGITIIVHPDNTVGDITIEQLRDIYIGNITNWEQVGGPDLPVILFGRQSTSGTYEFIKKHVLENQNFAASTMEQTGTAQIAEQVARTPGGIGYGGVGYFATRADVKELTIEGIRPNVENIISGEYPLWRYLYIYTDGVPAPADNPALHHYLSFIFSFDGQALNGRVEFLPLPAGALNEMRVQLGLELV